MVSGYACWSLVRNIKIHNDMSVASKKFVSILGAAATFAVALPVRAADLITASGLSATAGAAQLPNVGSIPSFVGGLINSLIGLMGTLFLALIIYGGFLWMTAAGNEDRVKKAKSVITAAITGVIITFAAYAITRFVTNAVLGIK